MADYHSKEIRSKNMSRIRSIDSKPEVIVRKFLFSQGLSYRKNDPRLPGKPDIVLPKYKTVVFVNGCFWHMHKCSRFVWPTTNTEYRVQRADGRYGCDGEEDSQPCAEESELAARPVPCPAMLREPER